MKKLPVLIFILIFLFSFPEKTLAANYNFAVIGNSATTPDIKNIYEMFNSLGITYKNLLASQITNEAVFNDVDAIVSFVDNSGSVANASAVNSFADNHIVISHGYDFANYYYPSLSGYYNVAFSKSDNYPVTYLTNWGNFRANDKVEMQQQDKRSLGIFLTTILESTFPNLLKITQYNSTHIASFLVNSTSNTGFYVMDLKATTNETEWAGIWHIFPAVKRVKDFPTGKYSRWMSNGSIWWDINWVYNRIDTLANQNNDISTKTVIGKSLEGRDIVALIIGKGNRNMIIDGSIHGDEKTGTFSALRTAELLLEFYRSSSSWQSKLNQYRVIIIPVLNPDGFVRNTRQNANSSLSPEIYHRSGSAMAINGTWISHSLPTSPAGIEGQYCTITPQDSNVKGSVFDAATTNFQVNLTNKSNGNPITTPTNISWDCRETCCNLNRQFPPKTPIEPEVLALINIFNKYPPVIYFNMHEGGATQCPDLLYTLDMFIGPYISGAYSNFAKYALHEANDTFTSLNHWGRFIEGGCNVPINKARIISVSGSDGTAHTYGSYAFRNTSSVILETYVWSRTWGARKSLWALDYYPLIILSHLKYYDNDGKFLYTSNGFIANTNMNGDKLNILLNTSELKESSTVFINDLKNKGKPVEVFIDGNKKNEGDGWSYDGAIKNITITGAINSILISWENLIPDNKYLVMNFSLNESVGSVAHDYSNFNNNGNIYGANWTKGKHNSALRFDGKDDYIMVRDNQSLDMTSSITIKAWIYPESWSSSFPRIASKELTITADPYALELNNSGKSVTFCLNTSAGSSERCIDSGTNSIYLNNWYQIVGTWNGTHSQIYINSELKGTLSLSGSMPATNNDVYIGNNLLKNRQFNGTIDEVNIYNYFLNSSEILNIYSEESKNYFSGNLTDKNGKILNATISMDSRHVLAEHGTYMIKLDSGIYSIQYNMNNFSNSNLWIKLLNFNVASDYDNLLNYVTRYNNNLSFIVDAIDNQTAQIYSDNKPEKVKINGSEIQYNDSLSIIPSWNYDSTNKTVTVKFACQ